MKLLELKKLLMVSRPLLDFQRVNLIIFGCCLLRLYAYLNNNYKLILFILL